MVWKNQEVPWKSIIALQISSVSAALSHLLYMFHVLISDKNNLSKNKKKFSNGDFIKE